jgi:hypothetical protein
MIGPRVAGSIGDRRGRQVTDDTSIVTSSGVSSTNNLAADLKKQSRPLVSQRAAILHTGNCFPVSLVAN